MAIYLDYNATAPLRPAVQEVMQALLAEPLNASSGHYHGRVAKKHLEDARAIIAESLSVWADEVVFCGSATEANNWVMQAFEDKPAVVSGIEHSSVLAARDKPLIATVDNSGVIDLGFLNVFLGMHKPSLVSVMLANNETGVIQPISEISKICKEHGALLHCDAVQGIGKIPVDVGLLGVDLMTISGHKCGGPVGAAALIIRRGIEFPSMLRGGGQEMRKRASTENVAAIRAFAKAIEMTNLPYFEQLRQWLDWMEQMIQARGGIVVGNHALRLPNTSCMIMPNVGQETQLMSFDLAGFCVSAGSACSSGRIEPSHVLKAMGISDADAASAIRVSGGWATTEADILGFTNAWLTTCERLATKTR